MSDFSEAIANSIKNTFPNSIRGKCFFHLIQNVIKRYNKKRYEDLKEYIQHLGSCINSVELFSSWNLIKTDIRNNDKLQDISEDFISYFQKVYLTAENKNFYIGALPPGYGNTNNMLEGHHKHLKYNIFERKTRSMGKLIKLDQIIILIGDFLVMIPSVIREFSRTRSRDSFSSVPKYNHAKSWEKAQKLQNHIYMFDDLFIFSKSNFWRQGHEEITEELIIKQDNVYHDSENWKTLKECFVFSFFDGVLLECDCHSFWSYGYCKHSLAVSIYLEELTVTLIKVKFIKLILDTK